MWEQVLSVHKPLCVSQYGSIGAYNLFQSQERSTVKGSEFILLHQIRVFISVWFKDRQNNEAWGEIKLIQTLYSCRFQLYVILPTFLFHSLACSLWSEMTTSVSLALYWSELVITIADKMWAVMHKRGYK